MKKKAHEIPAAGIGDIDLAALAQRDPRAALEIRRIKELMDCGKERKDEFLYLCELLFDAGAVQAAEILLRRNLDFYEGQALYSKLFGTKKPEEFNAAIDAFQSQFSLELELVRNDMFLVSRFRTNGGPPRQDSFSLLSRPCEIKLGYIEQSVVEADVTLICPGRQVFQPDECLLMFFINGVWEIVDPLES